MNIQITPIEYTPYQKDFLFNSERFTVVEASTKAGKTAGMISFMIEKLHDTDKPIGWELWWVAPVYDQAKIAFNRMLRVFAPYQDLYKINHSNLSITAPTGRVIRFKSADKPDNLYGENVMGFVWDEFTRSKPDAWLALRSTLTATNGWGKFIGNYISSANWGHQLAKSKENDPDWSYHVITAWDAVDAGILSREEVEQAKTDLQPHKFAALYECRGSADPNQLYLQQAIESLWSNEVEKTGEKFATLDVAGAGRDKTVMYIWDGWVITRIVEFDDYVNASQWVRECARRVKAVLQEESIPEWNLCIDNGGMGGGVPQYFPQCVKYVGAGAALNKGEGEMYGNLRAETYDHSARRVNNGGIRIEVEDHRDKIALELQAIKWKAQDQASRLFLEAKKDTRKAIGRSTDHADNFAMREAFAVQGTPKYTKRALRKRPPSQRRNQYGKIERQARRA